MEQRLFAVLLSIMLLNSSALLSKERRKRTPEELERLDGEAYEAAGKKQYEKAVGIWLDILPDGPPEFQQTTRYNLGIAYHKLKRLAEAWHHMTIYLKNCSREDRKAGRKLEKIEEKLKESYVKLGIVCEPEGSLIAFGAAPTRKPVEASEKGDSKKLTYGCPLTWWFKPGKATFTVTSSGYEPATETIHLTKRGAKAAHAVKLKRRAAAMGTLVVQGKKRGFQVFLNGALEGIVPFRRKLKAGKYELMVGKPGKMPWKTEIVIEGGKTHTERPPNAQAAVTKVVVTKPPADPGKKKPGGGAAGRIEKPVVVEKKTDVLPWALIGAGAALAATGGVLNYLAIRKAVDLKGRYMKPLNTFVKSEEYSDLAYDAALKRWNEYHDPWKAGMDTEVFPKEISAYVLYGLGAAAAATGLILFFRDSGEEETSRSAAWLLPMPIPAGAGMSIQINY